MSKTERCPGSGDIVFGPDEPDGTVQCFKCGKSFLPMEKRLIDGVEKFFVPKHTRPARKAKKKGLSKSSTSRRRLRTRESRRRSRR